MGNKGNQLNKIQKRGMLKGLFASIGNGVLDAIKSIKFPNKQGNIESSNPEQGKPDQVRRFTAITSYIIFGICIVLALGYAFGWIPEERFTFLWDKLF